MTRMRGRSFSFIFQLLMLLILLLLLFFDLYNSLSSSSSTITTGVAFSLWSDQMTLQYHILHIFCGCSICYRLIYLTRAAYLLLDYQNLLTNPPVLSPFVFLF